MEKQTACILRETWKLLFVWSYQVDVETHIKVYRNFRACRGKKMINSNPSFVVSNIEVGRLQEACDQPTGCTRLGERGSQLEDQTSCKNNFHE